jgi:hypothetical protein
MPVRPTIDQVERIELVGHAGIAATRETLGVSGIAA